MLCQLAKTRPFLSRRANACLRVQYSVVKPDLKPDHLSSDQFPSAVPVPKQSKWKTTDSVPLTRDTMLDLLYGKTPLIKEHGFLTPSECAKYERELSRLVTPYTHNTGPTMRKVGIAQVCHTFSSNFVAYKSSTG